MVTAYLGLGSNVGDREANINGALAELVRRGACTMIRVSSLYETDPVGIVEQPDFLNAAAKIETALKPEELLAVFKEVERRLGREETVRWGPRIIDIDILLYGDRSLTEGNLEIPHPEMHRRSFVLTPLAEIAPEAMHPTLGLTIRQLSADIGATGVRKYRQSAKG